MLRAFVIAGLIFCLSACGIANTVEKLATDPGYFNDPEKQMARYDRKLYADAMAGDAASQFAVGVYILRFKSITDSQCMKNFSRGDDFIRKAAEQNYQPAIDLLNNPTYTKKKYYQQICN